ncbi:MAG TPA: G1 family glutamic endopeptidase [Bryobacteraceae bacterium]|nr:G1 family glutamic endopeptidase [Bryobacteraceae bacterium]
MSKYQIIHNVPIAACAAILMSGLAVPGSAQNAVIAPEQGFTIPPNVQTPVVLQTQPDAACDLHLPGVNDAAHTMRLYANEEGYVRVHLTVQEGSQEGQRVQLDCAAGGTVTTYPVRLRAAVSATADMPAPQAYVPTPKTARVLPALTEETAQQFSDRYLASLGYPPRPDATASPDRYAKWLDRVSRPMTVLPPHLISNPNITRQPRGVETGVEATTETSNNWSGLELQFNSGSYFEIDAHWNVPSVTGETGKATYSTMWIGMDGDPNNPHDPKAGNDLVQEGTEQDYSDLGGGIGAAHYYAWEEILPNQPTEQYLPGLSNINAGDVIQASIYICDSDGLKDENGIYACFVLLDTNVAQSVGPIIVPFGDTKFHGSEAEWIMERPTLKGGVLPNLANYGAALMTGADVENSKGVGQSSAKGVNITMTNGKDTLSTATNLPIVFTWHHFH